jgi:hypothetical protein
MLDVGLSQQVDHYPGVPSKPVRADILAMSSHYADQASRILNADQVIDDVICNCVFTCHENLP